MATRGGGPPDLKGYHLVSSLADLKQVGRKRITVDERVIVLFYVKDQVYALDHFCYHTGGPLELGDIEDSHGRMCVVCPWHKHYITLDTGESLYTSIDPANPKVKRYNQSKGVKQRTHHVLVQGDEVLVKLSDLSSMLDSDRYFTEEYRDLIESVLELKPNEQLYQNKLKSQHPAMTVPLHSTRTNLPPRR